MANINWSEIIAYILRLIADGLDKKDAINSAVKKFIAKIYSHNPKY